MRVTEDNGAGRINQANDSRGDGGSERVNDGPCSDNGAIIGSDVQLFPGGQSPEQKQSNTDNTPNLDISEKREVSEGVHKNSGGDIGMSEQLIQAIKENTAALRLRALADPKTYHQKPKHVAAGLGYSQSHASLLCRRRSGRKKMVGRLGNLGGVKGGRGEKQ